MEYISNNVQETIAFAKEFATNLKGGECLLLQGDLGAGKTHFVKGLALGLGIDDNVTSPTFALHNLFQGEALELNHFDFYRIDDFNEVKMLGLDEYFSQPNGVSAIEWSNNVKPLLPRKTITITISNLDENVRSIKYELPNY
ncbi:MAG: tRNA (adenosine(37)-N6)-threonylcarbamoyltransferase complex ATPase subunit type 1 TsaE [Clostridia bacterium]|nr:tRNA (adenosine(37)-N6)-threonylcarbamoyltransferase complex ATPase subunit type 1 TsaE [Clostridia bacterium]